MGGTRLEVCSGIWSATRVVVLLEVGVEGACRAGLVAEGSTGASHEVGVVLGDALLLAPHAPADDGNAAEEDGTAYAADDTADDCLLLGAEAIGSAA